MVFVAAVFASGEALAAPAVVKVFEASCGWHAV
jgi:hypothetical protein